jgi:hypothetical protein
MNHKDRFLKRIAEQIATQFSMLPDNTEVDIFMALELVFGPKVEISTQYEWYTETMYVFGDRLHMREDNLMSFQKCLEEYQPKTLPYLLDPSFFAMKYIGPLHTFVLRRYDALEEQLQKLPIQKNEQGILYREFKDTNQFLKRVFYLKQGETLNINAANENIWIKVLSGNGVLNKGEYEEIRVKRSKKNKVGLNNTLLKLSFEDEVYMRRSRNEQYIDHLIYTNSQVEDFVIYVAYC